MTADLTKNAEKPEELGSVSPTAEVPTGEALLEVRNLTKNFVAATNFFGKPTSYVRAVDDVSFFIRRGEAFGLVGESGCGKTTIGKMIVGLLTPSSGQIFYKGRDITALSESERRKLCCDIQLIFQDPYASLNPRMTIGQIVAEPIQTNKLLPANKVSDRVDELLELVGLAPYMKNRYPHEFSGGQRQRVGIARALALEPKLIVCDEPVSALDVSIQAQVLSLLADLKERLGLTYLFIAHGLNVVKHVSDRVGVMYVGKLMEVAEKTDLYHDPLCPYTQALFSAIPSIDPKQRRKRIILEGDVPSPIDPPPGCRFAARCYKKIEGCDTTTPDLVEIKPNHWCACRLYQ
ncbi:MAG: ATP-binding cassette domain-containing protein [Coriobacteriales bacterium]|nr:ATP-binding cassette domain-containing protein [Coriobacteriales bacterium]